MKVDTELPRRDPALKDRFTQGIILTCGGGGKATLSGARPPRNGVHPGARGPGGCVAWAKAGYPLGAPAEGNGGASSAAALHCAAACREDRNGDGG
jgi:hypothetical protein